MEVFWVHGYEAASMSMLTKAMGINPPSLYAAFGSKEGLFRQALDHYQARGSAATAEALNRPDLGDALRAFFGLVVGLQCSGQEPRGCLVVQGVGSCGEAEASVFEELKRRRTANETALRQRLERAQAEGALPADASPADLARFLAVQVRGLSSQARDGATREELQPVVELAVRAVAG